MKKILIISLSLLILISTGCSGIKKENKDKKINTNKEVIKNQKIGNLETKKTSLIYQNGQSVLTVLLTNKTNEDVKIKTVSIIVKDKKGNEMATLLGYFGGIVPDGESRTITATINKDITSASKIEYKINK